jgi:hypothetical protein
MIPDEQPKAASEQSEKSPAPGGVRRRSRRGGRRHTKRRTPNAPDTTGNEDTEATAVSPAESETTIAAETSPHNPEAEIESEDYPVEEPRGRVPARSQDRAARQERSEPEQEFKTPGVTGAIEQVTKIIEELKRVMDEMEEVLETLELAERQKIDDEREIESLQRALRQLHRSPASGPSNRR